MRSVSCVLACLLAGCATTKEPAGYQTGRVEWSVTESAVKAKSCEEATGLVRAVMDQMIVDNVVSPVGYYLDCKAPFMVVQYRLAGENTTREAVARIQ